MDNQETSQSPLPKKSAIVKAQPITMNFPEAMKMVILGKKVFRLEWEDREYYGFLNGNILSLHKSDGKNYQWIVSDGDLIATDWIVI